MSEVSTVEAREKLSDLVNRVAYGRERVTITRRGKAVAVLVPVEDALALEALEDHLDLREARKSLAEPGDNIPWEQIKQELGL